MDQGTVIRQLEKALSCEDEELRMRVEVLVDMLKDIRPQPQPVFPSIPQPTAQVQQPKKKKQPQVKGPGAIVGGEQITYTRPEGT